MAAIKPFYADDEELNDDSDLSDQALENAAMAIGEPELFRDKGMSGTVGLGSIAPGRMLRGARGSETTEELADKALKLEEASLGATHTGLLRQAWVRRVMWEEIKGRNFEVVQRPNGVALKLLGGELSGPAWNQIPKNQRVAPEFEMLSWTSKMGCPSFSLPAGGFAVGGSCQGANAGQTTTPPELFAKDTKYVTRVTGAPVVPNQAICQHCYATKGNYQYATVSTKQMMLYAWSIQAVKDGTFADVMSLAVDRADYQLGAHYGEKKKSGKPRIAYNAERQDLPFRRFFRIHDSGDFFSAKYIAAWKQVANNLPDIGFWAPTRVWATNWGIQAVKQVNSAQGNFAIRPSIYHVNERPPENTALAQAIAAPDSGFAEWSVVYSKKRKPEGIPKDIAKGARVTLPQLGMRYVPKGERATKSASAYQLVQVGEETAETPYNFDCQTYLASKNEAPSCRNATPPAGFDQQEEGCRACWLARDRVVNYTQH